MPRLAPPKRVLVPQAETPKLHKVLAQAGLGSRLEMEQLIMEGRISVNNEPAHIGQRIQFGDQIKVNGKPIRFRIAPPPARVIAYHKPVGEVVTNDDPQNRPTVFRKLPRLPQGKWQSVGRLDLNTEGLLLFTSSGELANKLMHPRFGLEREYAVRVLGALSNEEKQRLLDGVDLDDGRRAVRLDRGRRRRGRQPWYRVTISEGRNREVRRLFEARGPCRQPPDPHPLRRNDAAARASSAAPGWNSTSGTSARCMQAAGPAERRGRPGEREGEVEARGWRQRPQPRRGNATRRAAMTGRASRGARASLGQRQGGNGGQGQQRRKVRGDRGDRASARAATPSPIR